MCLNALLAFYTNSDLRTFKYSEENTADFVTGKCMSKIRYIAFYLQNYRFFRCTDFLAIPISDGFSIYWKIKLYFNFLTPDCIWLRIK